MNSPVQKIKERLSIEEVVSSYVKLEKAGANLKARCPFHNEKTPSFFVSPERESYYCFGCGAKGDIFTFVQEFEGLDFKGALKLLAAKAGVSISEWKKEDAALASEKERIYSVMEKATEYFSEQLKEEKEALAYLKSRGIEEKTIRDFRIGFAKSGWRNLRDHFKGSFSDVELLRAGLIKKSEKGDDYYDRFRGRIMFPVCDSSGRVVAFSGRLFPDNEQEAKYLNSPETPIFKKSSILFGIDRAKESIRKNDFSIIVEGQFDLLMSHQAGFRNTVATLGTALSDTDMTEGGVNNLGIVKRLSQNVVFVFDSDKAGFAAALRAAATALSLDMNVKGADTGEGYDPADLILKKGVDAWRGVIREAKHIVEFLLDKYISSDSSKDPLKTKLEVEKKIIPYLKYINNSVKRSHFISVISHKTGIREEDIRESLERILSEEKETKGEVVAQEGKNLFRKDYILRRLLGIIMWQQSIEKPVLDIEKTVSELSDILGSPVKDILEQKKEEAPDLIFEAEVFYGEGADLLKDVREMLRNFEEENLKVKREIKMRELQRAEEAKDKQKSSEILKEISELNKKIQD